MYFLFLFTFTWTWFLVYADKTRLREFYTAVMFSATLGLLTDLMMIHYLLWDYKGLPQSQFSTPLILDSSIYPVVTYLFLQGLPKTWVSMLKRTVTWSCFAVLFEWVTIHTGHMQHHLWWNLGFSFLSDNLIFICIIAIYCFTRPAYPQPPNSVR
ncbi:CBO0543 family protein [Effusibacillus dendaii]|uniref:Uncharacterized protein n=1 Tax=Effusibacillus dendaii TaxID=2743772 RepID=A0A7I8DCX5_9BACL|nr:CBO0543 family protein [Effusibacillus dendaii]BCJ86799.1 hypothetical protein skT53_17840 [Effusibacillus dendaii]